MGSSLSHQTHEDFLATNEAPGAHFERQTNGEAIPCRFVGNQKASSGLEREASRRLSRLVPPCEAERVLRCFESTREATQSHVGVNSCTIAGRSHASFQLKHRVLEAEEANRELRTPTVMPPSPRVCLDAVRLDGFLGESLDEKRIGESQSMACSAIVVGKGLKKRVAVHPQGLSSLPVKRAKAESIDQGVSFLFLKLLAVQGFVVGVAKKDVDPHHAAQT